MDEAVLTERLMAYDTSTPEGIRAGAEFVKAWFEAREVDVRHIDHHGLPVLIAESGPADGPVVILHGHIDVVPAFEHATDIVLLAQEIVVGPSSYPTEEIGVNARAFRQLGLGYTNLGAFLMSNGVPYDSDPGRGTAAAITALMTGRGYRQSAQVAAALGPYEHYGVNRDAHNNVMRMHRDASYVIPDSTCSDTALLEAARTSWNEAVALV